MEYQIVTFNLRLDVIQDGENQFSCRKPLIRQAILRHMPDIIGFQEVAPHMLRWLQESLPEYTVVGCGREADLGGEHMVAAFRRDRFDLLGLTSFWLSPTPDIPGTRYEEQSMCPRLCCRSLVRDARTGQVFSVYVTHLDHISPLARALGLGEVYRQIKGDLERNPMPVILMGDFNDTPDQLQLEPLAAEAGLSLTDATKGVGGTFHDYGREKELDQIDYIMVSKEFSPEGALLWTEKENGVYLSDHYPVEARLKMG